MKIIRPWLRAEAGERLAKYPDAHPDVIAHWQKLAAWVDPPEEELTDSST